MPPISKKNRAHKSGKGRLSGSKRESQNADRSELAVQNAIHAVGSGAPVDTLFARVMGHLGMGHVKANLPLKNGSSVEIKAQIPNYLGRKGTTPINSQTVVAIYTGFGFDTLKFDAGTHFKITSILRDSQAAQLVEAGVLPEWMTVKEASTKSDGVEEAYTFDYIGEDDEEDEEKATNTVTVATVATVATTVATVATVAATVATVEEPTEEFMAPSVPRTTVVPGAKAKSGKMGHRAGLAAISRASEEGEFDLWGL